MGFIYKEASGSELYHHGITGQEWGVKHGPPYPLNRSTHNQVVKGVKNSRSNSYTKLVPKKSQKERTYPTTLKDNYIPSNDYPMASKKAINAIRNNGPIEEQLSEYADWYTIREEENHRIRDAADLGLAALDFTNRIRFLDKGELVPKEDIDGHRLWFVYEDQTIGLSLIADMINRGYSSKDVNHLLDNVEKEYKNIDNMEDKYAVSMFELHYGNDKDFVNACEIVKNKALGKSK